MTYLEDESPVQLVKSRDVRSSTRTVKAVRSTYNNDMETGTVVPFLRSGCTSRLHHYIFSVKQSRKTDLGLYGCNFTSNDTAL